MELPMRITSLHHLALTVTDLERSRRFYLEILGLREIPRPPFSFPGAWFAVGENGQQLHLIVHTRSTFRERISGDDPLRMILHPHAVAGFPQIYILDPDRHVIEINAATLD